MIETPSICYEVVDSLRSLRDPKRVTRHATFVEAVRHSPVSLIYHRIRHHRVHVAYVSHGDVLPSGEYAPLESDARVAQEALQGELPAESVK